MDNEILQWTGGRRDEGGYDSFGIRVGLGNGEKACKYVGGTRLTESETG